MATASQQQQQQLNSLSPNLTNMSQDLLNSTLRNNFYEHNDISKSVNDIPGMSEDEERNSRVLTKMRQFIEKYQSIEHMLPPLDLSKVAEYSCSGILSKDELKMFMQPGISPITCTHPDAPKMQGDELEVGADLAAMLLVQVKILQQRAILSEDRANLTEQELVEVNQELKRAYQRYESLHSSQQASQDQVWDLELHIQDLNSQIDSLLTSNKDITEENKAISKRLERASDTIHHLKTRETELTEALDNGMKKYNKDTQSLRQTILKMHEDLNALERENSVTHSPSPSVYSYSNKYDSSQEDLTFPSAPLPVDSTPVNMYRPSPLKKEADCLSNDDDDEDDQLQSLHKYTDYKSRSYRYKKRDEYRRPSNPDSGYGDSSSRAQYSDSDNFDFRMHKSSREQGFRLSDMPMKKSNSNMTLDRAYPQSLASTNSSGSRHKGSYRRDSSEDWRHTDHQSNRLDSPAFTPRPTKAKLNKKDKSHRYSMPLKELEPEPEPKLSKKELHRLEAVSRLNNLKVTNKRHSHFLHSSKKSNQSNDSNYHSSYYTPKTHIDSQSESEEYLESEEASEDELQRFQRRIKQSVNKDNKSKRQSTYQLRTYELVLPDQTTKSKSKSSKSNQLKTNRASVITFLDPEYPHIKTNNKNSRKSTHVVNLSTKGRSSKVASRIFSMGDQLLLQEIVQVDNKDSSSSESSQNEQLSDEEQEEEEDHFEPENIVVVASSKLNSPRSTPIQSKKVSRNTSRNTSRVTSPLRQNKLTGTSSPVQVLASVSTPRAISPVAVEKVVAKIVPLKPESESESEVEEIKPVELVEICSAVQEPEEESVVPEVVPEIPNVVETDVATNPILKLHQLVPEQSIISLKEALNTPLPTKIPNLTSSNLNVTTFPRTTTLNSANSVPNLSKSTPLSQISSLPAISLKSQSTESFKLQQTNSSNNYNEDNMEPIPTIGTGQGYLADVAVSIQVTMQGQFLYKSTRSLLGQERRRLKFCWINPQQKYLYWSDVDPGTQRSLFMSGNSSKRNGCRSAFIRSIRMVPDSWTPTPSELPTFNKSSSFSPLGIGPNSNSHTSQSDAVPPLCLIIETPTKDIKLKARDENMHNIWELALTYLQSTVPTSLSSMSNSTSSNFKPSIDSNKSSNLPHHQPQHSRNDTNTSASNSSVRTSNLSIHDKSGSEASSFRHGIPASYQNSYATQLSVSGIQRGLFIPTPTKNKRRSVFSNRGHW